MDLLDKKDQQELIAKKEEAKNLKVATTTFRQELKKQSQLVQKSDKAFKDSQAKLKKDIDSKNYPKSIPEGPLTQQEAKTMLPPLCYIWRNTVQCQWQAHFPKGKRYFGRSWAMGHREACISVIVDVWSEWLTFHDFEEKNCPIWAQLQKELKK